MLKFLSIRIFQGIFVILTISFLSFLAINFAPGGFFDQLKLNPSVSAETIKQLEAFYGLNKPLLIRYIDWLSNALRFNLGYSIEYNESVKKLILERIPNTLMVSIPSAFLSWSLAFFIGVLSAFKKDTKLDKFLQGLAYISMSIPSFVMGFLIMMFFYQTHFINISDMLSGVNIKHLVLPVSALVLSSFGGLSRLVRANVIEILNSPMYIFLKASRVNKGTVVWHVLRNAMPPFIVLLGYELSSLISGAALVEIVTNWPGMGLLILNAVLSKDLFLVMGSLYVGSIMLVLGNIIADILLFINDPRIKRDTIF
ncbi:MAG: ABC transporter permease [Hydrogenobaculum sp.]|nr:MAG: ABC transporter substrate-binding protein [Hydrogenobaculum sp.]PMP93338.1 MAG: ABC transporter substrate-binding protein [Hydrogenobaculum sp.]HEK25486.1 ABC transporter permease [Hydrogenobaculum sp.]